MCLRALNILSGIFCKKFGPLYNYFYFVLLFFYLLNIFNKQPITIISVSSWQCLFLRYHSFKIQLFRNVYNLKYNPEYSAITRCFFFLSTQVNDVGYNSRFSRVIVCRSSSEVVLLQSIHGSFLLFYIK